MSHWARAPQDTDGDFAKFGQPPSGQGSKLEGSCTQEAVRLSWVGTTVLSARHSSEVRAGSLYDDGYHHRLISRAGCPGDTSLCCDAQFRYLGDLENY